VPAVTKTYSFTESAAAYKYLATGHARGKIVIMWSNSMKVNAY